MGFAHAQMFQDLVAQEGITVRYKNEHWWWRALGRTLCKDSPTAIGTTVYMPSRAWVTANPKRAWMALCHELVHVEDYRSFQPSVFYYLLYGFPQWLAVLAALSLALWSWWPMAFLLFLAPWPGPWRHQYEMRGYAMGLAVEYWYRGRGIPIALKEEFASQFKGPSYLYWPFKRRVTHEVGRWTKRILCNEVDTAGDVFRRLRLMILSRL